MLQNEELQRYNRHIIMPEIGLSGQEKLKASRVLVIGSGGLGSPVLQYLTAAGVGTIGIADFDTVSLSNLQRQILFTTGDVGKPKAKTAAKRLKKLNPFIKFEVYNKGISIANVKKILARFDIIIDGSDNFPTRYMVNDACIILNKPLVFGAIFKFYGQVSVFNFNNGPTYRCLFPEPPEQNEIPNCATIGVLGAVPGIIGSLQAAEVLKIILGTGEILTGKVLQIDLLTLSFDIIQFEKNPENGNIKSLGNYGVTCAVENDEEKSYSFEPSDLQHKIKKGENIEIIDLRTKQQFDSYNIGGQNITANRLFADKTNLPSDKTVVFVCEFGEQSLAITEYYRDKYQLNNCYNLTGGIQAWIADGFEIKR